MSKVLPSQKSDLLSILIRAPLVGMLVQPETVPTEGSDEFVCPTGSSPPRPTITSVTRTGGLGRTPSARTARSARRSVAYVGGNSCIRPSDSA
jgi:hypothetical protein